MEKECECYEEEVQPYRKTDYKPIIYIYILESVSEISSPRWSSECQSVECAFTSPMIIELGMLMMYCMQFVMSVSVVSMVSWCGVVVFLGAMYMLAMLMSLKCFMCILRRCISVLSVLMTCGVLMCVNVVSDLM